MNTLLQRLQELKQDPAQINTGTFLQLVDILDGQIGTNNGQQHELTTQVFQAADKLLIRFSSLDISWQTTFEVLKMEGLRDSQYFQAANIFKNKLKYDLVTIKSQPQANIGQIFVDLMAIIKTLAGKQSLPATLKSLCMGLTYMIYHLHSLTPAEGFIAEMQSQLGGDLRQVQCYLYVVEYLASECEDDEIVVEETVRNSYYTYMDKICANLFASLEVLAQTFAGTQE